MNVKADPFCENLRYLAKLHRKTQQNIADELGCDRSVIGKLMTGGRKPNTAQRLGLGRFFRIEPSSLDLSHDAFRKSLEGELTSSSVTLMTFRTVRENTTRWRPLFDKYKGQYTIYYRQSVANKFVASLLSIDRLTADGLHATVINPHRNFDEDVTAYEYEGYAYPVREYLYVILEQKNADYELLSLTMHEARTPSVKLLKGLMSGIGVDANEESYIAARPIVVVKRTKLIERWTDVVGKELGHLNAESVRRAVRDQLSEEKITIRSAQ